MAPSHKIRRRSCRGMSRPTEAGTSLLAPRTGPSRRCRRHGCTETSSSPATVGVPPCHILGHARLRDIDAELEQFAINPRCSPQGIGQAHLSDQLPDLERHLRSSPARPRFPAPVGSKPRRMPPNDSLWPDDRQRRSNTNQANAFNGKGSSYLQQTGFKAGTAWMIDPVTADGSPLITMHWSWSDQIGRMDNSRDALADWINRTTAVTRPAQHMDRSNQRGATCRQSCRPPHIGGVRPSRPTEMEAASSVPSSLLAAPAMKILAPDFSSLLSPGT